MAMGDSSGASSSMRNSSGASRGEVAETGSAFHGCLCGGNKTLSSAKNTTSNLKKHLNSKTCNLCRLWNLPLLESL